MEDWSMENFGFAFNDSDFSDRILHIEIITDGSSSPNKKKHQSIHATLHSNDSVSCVGVQVKTLHIISPILAAKSPFFYKLFKNEMIESHQSEVTLRINSSEEAALMDVLNFMYNNTLSATTCSDLLDVLIAADKFVVTSCVRYCIELLLKMPMSLESALLYLELPLTVLVVQPLIDASKKYLVARYRDFNDSKEEAIKLPLFALEVVLGSEGLQVETEDDIFEFILEWGLAHYPKLKDRREILTKRLAQFICFPNMSCSMLKEVLVSAVFEDEQVSKLVMEALFCKAEAPYGQHITKPSFLGRLYNYRFVKVVQLEFSSPRCVIYFDLKKEECSSVVSSKVFYSEPFILGGRWFYLSAERDTEQESLFQDFLLFLHMKDGAGTCTIEFEFAVMKKTSKKFESQGKADDCIISDEEGWGLWFLSRIPWTTLMSDDNEYFIDEILHLQAELTMIHSQA